MTRDEIAQRMCPPGGLEAPEWVLDTIEAIVREAVAAEREACAKVSFDSDHMGSVNLKMMRNRIGNAIRARGETT